MTWPTSEPAPQLPDDHSAADLPLIDLEALLDRPPSRRKRLAQVGVGLLVALVALALFWSTSGPAAPPLPSVPGPSKPILSRPPVLLIFSSVNTGTLTINGSQQQGSLPMLVAAHGNTQNISLSAPPFQSVTCQVNLPSIESAEGPFGLGGCTAFPIVTTQTMTLNGVVAVPTVQVYLTLGLHDLPPDQQSQITTLLNQALTVQQSLAVPAGSYFATSFQTPATITSQRASAPLHATGIIALAIPQEQQAGSACDGFICSQAIEFGTAAFPSGLRWAISVGLTLRWRFSSATGAAISSVVFQGDNSGDQIGGNLSLLLAFDQAQGWTLAQDNPVSTLSVQAQNAFCATGESLLQHMAQMNTDYSINVLNDQRAQGCELQAFDNNVYQGAYLWRFGVLLAVDAQAHAAYPQLPMAPQAELAALGT